MILKILRGFVETRCSVPGSLLILNGLPRHRQQAEGLAGVLTVERIVRLEAEASVIRDRIRLDPEATGPAGRTIPSRRSRNGYPTTASARCPSWISTGPSAFRC